MKWLAARARPIHVSSLPDPMFTYTEMIEPIQTRVGPLQRSVQFRQVIPYPAKLKLKGAMATEQARVKELEYHIALRDVVAELKVSYAELVYLRRAIEIVEQNQQLATHIATRASTMYGATGVGEPDTLSLFDTLKAQSSLAQLAYDKVTLEELRANEETKINTILSQDPSASVLVTGRLPFRRLHMKRKQLYDLAHDRRQEIQAATHKLHSARHAERLARLAAVPDFSLGIQYSFVGNAIGSPPGEGDDAVGIGLGFTVPLWGPKNRAKREEAHYLRHAAEHAIRAETDSVHARISKVFVRLQNAERLVRLYRESLIPQAKKALNIAEARQEAGRDLFGRLLEARMVWLNFQLAEQRALVDHEQMVARLEQLVGISLNPWRSGENTR